MTVEGLISKQDGWLYVNAVILYLGFFPLPDRITTSSIFIIATFGITALADRLSSLESLHKVIFKRQLIRSEIQRRQTTSNYDYDDLSSEGQNEVDKIDDHFHEFAKTFSGLLFLTTLHLFLLTLQITGVISRSSISIDPYSLNILYLGMFAVIVNVAIMYDSYQEIRRYMFVDLKEVYDKYSGED